MARWSKARTRAAKVRKGMIPSTADVFITLDKHVKKSLNPVDLLLYSLQKMETEVNNQFCFANTIGPTDAELKKERLKDDRVHGFSMPDTIDKHFSTSC
nr:plant cysteine oxidase 3 [Tanacetum cinerariifolium]